MLDGAAHTASLEELAYQVDRRTVRVSHVSSVQPQRPLSVYERSNLARLRRRLLWGLSGTFFGVYVIVLNLNVPLIVQPQLLAVLSYLSWAQVS